MITNLEQVRKRSEAGLGKIRTYSEVVEYLDALKPAEYAEASLKRMKDLDQQLGNVASAVDVVTVGGTNGKSSTMHFAAKLLIEEGFKVGIIYSSHLLTYNERLVLHNDVIAN